jgi:amino acid transporter
MTPSNPLSTVSLVLTLASLLGSFFYLQLSQWLRDVLALRQKAELNKLQGTEPEKRAIVECRVEFQRLSTWHSYAVNLIVIAFVLFMLILGLDMIRGAKADQLYWHIHLAMVVFLVLFSVLAAGLLSIGSWNAWKVSKLLP